ncbi:penicillin-binding protein [Cytobacillus kochii]
MYKKQRNMNVGAAILFMIFSLLFFVLLFRFISIQVSGEAGGKVIAAQAEQLYQGSTTIESKRGTIYDRNGNVIAEDSTAYTLVAVLSEKMTKNKDNPKHVVEPDETAKQLAEVIDMEESEIYERLTINERRGKDEQLFQVEFGRAGQKLTVSQKKKIEKLELPGIVFQPQTIRFYPNGTFASHLIGYVDSVEGEDGKLEDKGIMGLEKSLNDLMLGEDGKFSYEKDIWGYLLPNGEEVVEKAEDGNDVYLTIDNKIQIFLEEAMSKVSEKYDPEKMVAVVADPKTGEILAMSQRPTFNPETREGIDQTWRNLAIEDSFEPGSTMKAFTLAAAIEEGVFTPNATFESGTYKVTEKSPPVRDHNNGQGWGSITYLEGIQRSSNVAIAKMVKDQLGYETYREYLTKFGFEEPTGIDLPNEAGGKIVYEWPFEKVTTAYGQGTAITPIQQIQAATAIASDGSMKQPHVISEIINPNNDKVVKEAKEEIKGQPISENTAKEVRKVLETVVSSENGTGHNHYQIDGYKVAGKTGTAQIPKEGGGYITGRENYVFSFLGMAPAEDPELLVYVAVQQPALENTETGSDPVSEIFKPVMKNSLSYLSIEPTDYDKLQVSKGLNFEGKSVEQAKKSIEKNGMQPIIIGDGKKVVEQSPGATESVLEGEKVILKTDGKLTVPDLTGWSMRDVMKFVKLSNLKLNSVGNGFAVKQNLAPGSAIKEDEYLIVDFQQSGKKSSSNEGEELKDDKSASEQ